MRFILFSHCIKCFRIGCYSGLYSVQMRENTDQNNSEYGYFLRSVGVWEVVYVVWNITTYLLKGVESVSKSKWLLV